MIERGKENLVHPETSGKLAYGAINKAVMKRIPSNVTRMLDLGCGTGSFGHSVKQSHPCQIVGVTYSEEEATTAREMLDKVLVCDLNDFSPDGLGKFDCIVCSHVLEHLYEPQLLLGRIHDSLTPDGTLIVALPNILLWRQRLQFLLGRFRYTDGGLMDRTHFRFFDWNTAALLVEEAGFQITEREADGYLPLPGVRRLLGGAAKRLDQAVSRKLPGFFGKQFVISARTKQDNVKKR